VSFLTALASAGLTRIELQSFDPEHVIRIEKRLIAESRLNNTLSKNDVSQIIIWLQTYPTEIKFAAGYECLWGILSGIEAERLDSIAYHTPPELEGVKEMIAAFFAEDLERYVKANAGIANWNNLRVLWYYRRFLPDTILSKVADQTAQQLEQALRWLNQKPPAQDLLQEVGYLTDSNLYLLLNEFHESTFNPYINQLITFFDNNPEYVKASDFYTRFCSVVTTFKTEDGRLNLRFFNITNPPDKWATEKFCLYAFIVLVIAVLPFYLLFTGGNKISAAERRELRRGDIVQLYHPDVDQPADSYRPKRSREYYWEHDPEVQMHVFAEARTFPLNDPPNSLTAPELKTGKYINPFANPVFNHPDNDIKHGGPSLSVFNQTDNECVVIAYYDLIYYRREKKYVDPSMFLWISDDKLTHPYALYLPPHDSLKIDLRMSRLRFYMGKRLASFNTLRRNKYADSLDAKFSLFTRTDSLLFSNAFNLTDDILHQPKSAKLMLTQPNAHSYQIMYTGKPLKLYQNYVQMATGKQPDVVSTGNKILLDLETARYDDSDNQTAKTFMALGSLGGSQ
jgi:hypothetical protein